jgi:hypothetical protein
VAALCAATYLIGLQEILKPKNISAGYARRNIFGFYMNYFFLGSLIGFDLSAI